MSISYTVFLDSARQLIAITAAAPTIQNKPPKKNIATARAEALLEQDIQQRIKDDRERRKQQKEDEAFAASLTPDDLDRMAYTATGNSAELADMGTKKEKRKVS